MNSPFLSLSPPAVRNEPEPEPDVDFFRFYESCTLPPWVAGLPLRTQKMPRRFGRSFLITNLIECANHSNEN